jgi:hypothetical protein
MSSDRTRTGRCFLPVLLLFVPLHTAAALITLDAGIADLRGEIAKGDVEKIHRVIESGATILRIHSPGGDVAESILVARAIRKSQARVQITGLCASACALLILPAARSLVIDDGSVIALHAAGHGAWLAAEREGLFEGRPEPVGRMLATMRTVTQDMRTLWADVGVNLEAVEFMYSLTSVGQLSAEWTTSPNGEPMLKLSAKRAPVCTAWLLGPESLKALGVRAPIWRPAGLLAAALALNEAPETIYEGPPASTVQLELAISCRDVKTLRSPLRLG